MKLAKVLELVAEATEVVDSLSKTIEVDIMELVDNLLRDSEVDLRQIDIIDEALESALKDGKKA